MGPCRPTCIKIRNRASGLQAMLYERVKILQGIRIGNTKGKVLWFV